LSGLHQAISQRGAMIKAMLVLAALGVAASTVVSAADAPVAYAWKAGDVYRFDFYKSITLSPLASSGTAGAPAEPADSANPASAADQRKTEVAGILIFEVATDGKATMRFDSPRVTLPEVIFYSSQAEEPEPQKDKNRVIGKAIEGALKAARWDVQLGSDGTLHIRDRKPNNFIEWAKDVETAAAWRKKSFKGMQQLIDNDLGLKTQVDDREIFLCMNTTPVTAQNAKAEASLRPVRSSAVLDKKDAERARFKFSRSAPENAGKPYAIPDLGGKGEVTTTLNQVQTAEGSAVMALRLSMLDSLTADFTSEITVQYGNDSVQRQVRVQYRLKRLAPPISKP
jgi:hypothetical protein